MSHKPNAIAFAIMLGLSTLGLPSAVAHAAMFPSASFPTTASGQAVIQIGDRRNNNHHNGFDENFDGNFDSKRRGDKRCNPYDDGCRPHFRGRHDINPRRGRPSIVGDGFAPNIYLDFNDYYDESDAFSARHIRYCLSKYRSYDPHNNTWVARGGKIKWCNSPYM